GIGDGPALLGEGADSDARGSSAFGFISSLPPKIEPENVCAVGCGVAACRGSLTAGAGCRPEPCCASSVEGARLRTSATVRASKNELCLRLSMSLTPDELKLERTTLGSTGQNRLRWRRVVVAPPAR